MVHGEVRERACTLPPDIRCTIAVASNADGECPLSSPHLFAASYVASTPSLALFLSLFRPPQHVVILHVRMYHAHAGMKVCAT